MKKKENAPAGKPEREKTDWEKMDPLDRSDIIQWVQLCIQSFIVGAGVGVAIIAIIFAILGS